MKPDTTGYLLAAAPLPPAPAVGCTTCWAAKYCAAFTPEGPQPPPACPLVPKPSSRPRRQAALRLH